MKRRAILLLALAVAGCGTARDPSAPVPPPESPPPIAQGAPPPHKPQETPPAPADQGANPVWTPGRGMNRDQVRAGLEQLVNLPGAEPKAALDAMSDRLKPYPYGPDALPYAQGDLDGDGAAEYMLALPVTDPGPSPSDYRHGMGAALFVIHWKDGRWQVDRTDPMAQRFEIRLMDPTLHAVADLAGLGRPQILWSRRHMIATGLQPTSFFVTAWAPGAFATLPGDMAVSRTRKGQADLVLEGRDLVLTGGSRSQMFLRPHTDRYRFLDGAFRLVDRRFQEAGETGYDRFWDGLVAEQVGRVADAERSYREAADLGRKAHPGQIIQYPGRVIQLTPDELARFERALRAFARFRLGALLKAGGAPADLGKPDGPHAGLLEAMHAAPTRAAGCAAAAAWAEANPGFLADFNLGVSDDRFTPALLCNHPSLEDHL